jgi:hypothetical protein
MVDGSEEAGIIIAKLEAGAGITVSMTLVNTHRIQRAENLRQGDRACAAE